MKSLGIPRQDFRKLPILPVRGSRVNVFLLFNFTIIVFVVRRRFGFGPRKRVNKSRCENRLSLIAQWYLFYGSDIQLSDEKVVRFALTDDISETNSPVF